MGLVESEFFTEKASWGKVVTLDWLIRRGWSPVNRCFLYKFEE